MKKIFRNANNPEFLKWFLSISDNEKVNWILTHRPIPVVASGEQGDPCRWCYHWNKMCSKTEGCACIDYANFRFAYRNKRISENNS